MVSIINELFLLASVRRQDEVSLEALDMEKVVQVALE